MSIQVKRPGAGRTALIGVAVATVTSIALPMIKDSEGLRTKAYRDSGGVPTICFGETLGVRMGDQRTVAQCEGMLDDRLIGFVEDMRACTTVALPAKTEAALLSFTYNLGIGTYCRNMAERRINQGKLWAACEAMSLYTQDNGRVLAGLVTRRAEERALCEEGLREAGILKPQ